MYAVIFKAEINKLDNDYEKAAIKMRDLAINKYACCDFVSSTENNTEIAISYWNDLEHIKQWKQDPEHLAVQDKGKSDWYKSYSVQIVEVIREYTNDQ